MATVCSPWRGAAPANTMVGGGMGIAKTYTVDEFGTVKGELRIMSEIYARGPVACYLLSAVQPFDEYVGGVIQYPHAVNTTDHVVVIAGWGRTDDGLPYWIGRNSYGTRWGEGVGGGWCLLWTKHSARRPGFQPWKNRFLHRRVVEQGWPQDAVRESSTPVRQKNQKRSPEGSEKLLGRISKVARKNSKSCSEDFQMDEKLLIQILAHITEITNKKFPRIEQKIGRKISKTRPEELENAAG